MVGTTGQQIWQKVVNKGLDMKSVLTQLSPHTEMVITVNATRDSFLLRAFSSLHPIKNSTETTNLLQRVKALNAQEFHLKPA